MKIIIAYDGSLCANAAINELTRAGLPETGEALVLTVAGTPATTIPLPPGPRTLREIMTERLFAHVVSYARAETLRAKRSARSTAAYGARRFSTLFPNWKVNYRVPAGDVVEKLLTAVDLLRPDLILVGSNRRSAMGRFFLGSVSSGVAQLANCAVRIVHDLPRASRDKAISIVAGSTTPYDNELIMKTLCSRSWPAKTSFHIIAADDRAGSETFSSVYPYTRVIIEQSVEPLVKRGHPVSIDVTKGDLRSLLIDAAVSQRADTIYFASPPGAEQPNPGAEIMAESECSVEIVR